MATKNKWTRNQLILLGGLILSLIGLIVNFLYLQQISEQQVILRQNLDEINATNGTFKYLKVDNLDAKINFTQIVNFPVGCSDEYAISFINFSGGYTICSQIN